ncbi:unnamed protein product [Callosobruchus maculatus]|uniref:Uncharacterized protein n=1 Tax=Callosobruchus maculatus TaxID=64391 RepID=A0A653C1C7_CALMS|nr:unnamed protein product [Callosobruchus maculatus]
MLSESTIMQGTNNHLRMSKRFTTELYADQLAPLYPHLKPSQIKAALILSENNMHECRLILDMKRRFLNNCQKNVESKLECNATTTSHKQVENEDKFSSCETSTFTFRASNSSVTNVPIFQSDRCLSKQQCNIQPISIKFKMVFGPFGTNVSCRCRAGGG